MRTKHATYVRALSRTVLASAFAALVSQTATAQDWTASANFIAALIASPPQVSGGTSLLLKADSATAPNELLVQDDYSYLFPGGVYSGWENTTWAGTVPGTKEPVGFFPADTSGGWPDFDLTMRTVTLRDVDMQMGSTDPVNTGNVRLDLDGGVAGNPIGLTLENASVAFDPNPLWRSDHPLSVQATSGDNVISELDGNQAPETTISVFSGTTLQILDSGTLGGGSIPDSSRLNFVAADNSAVIDGGTLDINLSHLIYPTGTNEMLVQNGGALQINGGDSTLETGTLRVNNSTLQMSAGGTTLEAGTLKLEDATVVLGGGARANTGITETSGTTGIDLGDSAKLTTDGLTVEGSGTATTLSGTGSVEAGQVAFVSADATTALNITESAALTVTAGGSQSVWTSGSVNLVGSEAQVLIEDGANVSSSIPIDNEGQFLVDGKFQPEGTMTGDGFMRVRAGGELGPFGNDAGDTFTATADVFMDAASTFEVVINPTLDLAQQLIVESLFSLGNQFTGVFLDLNIIDDVILPSGTKYAIVDYLDGIDLSGGFMRSDLSPLLEGDLITAGLNQYRLSYLDPDFDPSNSSVITLTVDNAIPAPSSIVLASLGLLGMGAVRRSRRRRAA